jgi:hypothetical protein
VKEVHRQATDPADMKISPQCCIKRIANGLKIHGRFGITPHQDAIDFYYGVTLGFLALKPSGFCNIGVYSAGAETAVKFFGGRG